MKNNIKNFLTELYIVLIPVLSVLMLVLLLYIPRTNSYWNFLRQAPFYAGIYFWQIQRPDAFHFFSAFVLGLIADVLEGTAMGVNIIAFLTLYFICLKFSSKFNIKRFSYSWLLFSAAFTLTLLLKVFIASVLYRKLLPLNLVGMEFFLTIAIYPILTRIYIWAERHYIPLEERYEKIPE